MIKRVEEVQHKMLAWLLGTQGNDLKNKDIYGGFPAWIDGENQLPSFCYSEITGYGLSLLSFLSAVNYKVKRGIIEKSAQVAYNWIEYHFWKNNGINTRIIINSVESHLENTANHRNLFDTGMILNGLVNYYHKFRSENTLSTAVSVADYILDTFYDQNKKIKPVITLEFDQYRINSEKWSVQDTAYLAKVGIGFAYLVSKKGYNRYKSFLDALLALLIENVSECGMFKSYHETGRFHFHPVLYAVEASFFLGEILGKSDLTKIAIDNMDLIFKYQNSNGELPSLIWDDKPVYAFRSDIQFQAIRMGLILDEKTGMNKYRSSIEKAIEFVLNNYVWLSKNKAACWYGIDAEPIENRIPVKRKHLNVWATMFAIQALSFYNNTEYINLLLKKQTYIV